MSTESTYINDDKSKDGQPSGMNIWLKIVLILLAVIIVSVIALSIYLYFHGIKYFGTSSGTLVNSVVYLNYKFYDKVFSLKPSHP